MSSAAYFATVEATVARLRAAEARPKPVVEAVVADASKVAHFCAACELSWRGPAPCWSCAGPGATHSDLTHNERLLWAFSNATTGTFSEGEQ